MNIFVLALLFYLLYRFIGGFLIPLLRTSRTIHRQFRDMNEGMNGQGPVPGEGAPKASNSGEKTAQGSKVGEYIDFEEVK